MSGDFELQCQDAIREIILDGDFRQIAIWLDGEWAVAGSPLYETKSRGEKPIFILVENELLSKDEDEDFLEMLIEQIEDKVNSEIK